MSDTIETTGTVEKILGNNNYLVHASMEGRILPIMCYLAGKMRQNKISILLGDEVKVSIPPPYDKGRIVFREK